VHKRSRGFNVTCMISGSSRLLFCFVFCFRAADVFMRNEELNTPKRLFARLPVCPFAARRCPCHALCNENVKADGERDIPCMFKVLPARQRRPSLSIHQLPQILWTRDAALSIASISPSRTAHSQLLNFSASQPVDHQRLRIKVPSRHPVSTVFAVA
jgi:hypothetical protein